MKISTLIDITENKVVFVSPTCHDLKEIMKQYRGDLPDYYYEDYFVKQTFEIDIYGGVKEILD